MKYAVIAEAYEKIDATTKRLEMTDLLVGLLKNTPKEIIDKVVYLTQGRIYPDFVSLEIGVAEKLAIKALAKASGIKKTDIENDIKKSGDIGETA
ncbi:MAG TPA: DNA ligase, partial [Candidatus Bathyarchaeia archaeon]